MTCAYSDRIQLTALLLPVAVHNLLPFSYLWQNIAYCPTLPGAEDSAWATVPWHPSTARVIPRVMRAAPGHACVLLRTEGEVAPA